MVAMFWLLPPRCAYPCGTLPSILRHPRTPYGGASRSRNVRNGAVNWEGVPPSAGVTDPIAVLSAAGDRDIEEELIARRDRPEDPAANFSGKWWSRPPWELPSSARELFDGSPAKLWFVEDSLRWERAEATRLGVASGLRVYQIDSAEAWARLCGRFPIEVTAQKRHDWYRTTGRAGARVIPDRAKVAQHYDAIHQVQAYLSAVGIAIPVDGRTASVIAGWDPDQTYWFTPNVRYRDEPVTWAFSFRNDRTDWVKEMSAEDDEQPPDANWAPIHRGRGERDAVRQIRR